MSDKSAVIPKFEKISDKRKKWTDSNASVNMSNSIAIPNSYFLPAGETSNAESKPVSSEQVNSKQEAETEWKSCVMIPEVEHEGAEPVLQPELLADREAVSPLPVERGLRII